MPDAVYLITLLKFGAIGLSTYISLHGIVFLKFLDPWFLSFQPHLLL